MPNYETWTKEGIPSELRFHQANKWRQSEEFYNDSKGLFSRVGFKTFKELEGKTILDAGCGSKLRTAVFEGAKLIGLDPLLSEFSKIKWSDLNTLKETYSIPLESCSLGLMNRMDAIFCVNVLDHCYEWERVLDNLCSYLKDSGTLYLMLDVNRQKENVIHQRIDTGDLKIYLERIFTIESEAIEDKGFDSGCNKIMLVLKRK